MTEALWANCTVEDIAAPVRNALVGGPFGSNLVSRDYTDTGVPVIRGQNMGENRWVGGQFAYVTEEKANSLAANLARPGDIIFTQRGTLGQVAIVPAGEHERYLVSQSQMKLTPDPTKADVLYLYYLFRSPSQQEYIRTNAVQTGVPHTNLGILRTTPLRLPPLLEQKRIAAVLGALDDKIELNRQTNQTLEALAQRLFKSWFVDFDPVKAKMAGRTPAHMDAETAALFPDRLVESEVGLIPEGWTPATLAELVEINPREKLKKGLLTPYVEMAVLPTQGMCIEGLREREFTSGSKFRFGDTLLARITPCLENGKAALFMELSAEQVAWGSTEFIVMRPREGVPVLWPYLLARNAAFREYAIQHMAGTSGRQRVAPQSIAQYPLAVPSQEVLKAFEAAVSGFAEKAQQNVVESRVLARLRDRLLPKLISGQLRVRDAERHVAEVV